MKKSTITSLLLLCVCAFTPGKEFPTFFLKMKAVQKAVYLSITTDQIANKFFQSFLDINSIKEQV